MVGGDDVYRSCHTNCHVAMKCRERILSGGTVRGRGETRRQRNRKTQQLIFTQKLMSLLPPPPTHIHPARRLPLSRGAIIVNHLLSEAGVRGR